MPSSLSSLVDNLSEINNKKPENEFTDNIRSMATSLSHSVDNLPEINKKNRKIRKKNLLIALDLCHLHYHIVLIIYLRLIKKNWKIRKKIIDSFRSMVASLSHSVDNLSEINKKIGKSENKFIDNYRSMLASLSHSVDNLSEISKKISLIELSKKFHNIYQLCNKDLNK